MSAFTPTYSPRFLHGSYGNPRRPPCSRPCSLRTSKASSTPLCAAPPTSRALDGKPKLFYVGVVQAGEGMSPSKTQWAEQFDGNLTAPRITKPDDEFAKLGLEFVVGKEGVVLAEVNDLFEKVGFPRRPAEKLETALKETYYIMWVRTTKQSRIAKLGQLIGFARATSDGSLTATIWDVAVNPAWQRLGLGRALIERITSKLVQDGIPTITLYAEPKVVGLYEKLGFVKDPSGIKGMAFQRQKKERQTALLGR